MTAETKARDNWIAAVQMFGKGSKEDLQAYNDYIKVRSGEGRKQKARRTPTVRKAAEIVTASLF